MKVKVSRDSLVKQKGQLDPSEINPEVCSKEGPRSSSVDDILIRIIAKQNLSKRSDEE